MLGVMSNRFSGFGLGAFCHLAPANLLIVPELGQNAAENAGKFHLGLVENLRRRTRQTLGFILLHRMISEFQGGEAERSSRFQRVAFEKS